MKASRDALQDLREDLAWVPEQTRLRVERRGGLSHADLLQLVAAPPCDDIVDPECISPGDVFVAADAGTVDRAFINNVPGEASWKLPGKDLIALEGYWSYQLALDNRLVFDGDEPALHRCGTAGALVEAAKRGLVAEAESAGVECIYVWNGRSWPCDCELVGHHVTSGAQVTCEVAPREPGSKSDAVCWVDGRLQAVEFDRVHGDLGSCSHCPTGTFVVSVDLPWRSVSWRWRRVRSHVGNKIVTEHRRSLYDLTRTFDAQYVECTAR